MSSIESLKAAYEKHKKTPAGMKAQKAKAAHQKKMMGKQAISIGSGGKITGIHHAKAATKKK